MIIPIELENGQEENESSMLPDDLSADSFVLAEKFCQYKNVTENIEGGVSK